MFFYIVCTPNSNLRKQYYLGTGISFDVSKYNGYKNFTEDNFIVGIDSVPDDSTQYGAGTRNWAIAGINHCQDIVKSYDSAKGILTLSGGNFVLYVSDYDGYKSSKQVQTTLFAYLVI